MTKDHERLIFAVAWSAATLPPVMTVGYALAALQHRELHVFSLVFACATAFIVGWPCALVCGAFIAAGFGKRVMEGYRPAAVGAVVVATVVGFVGVSIVWTSFEEIAPYSSIMSIAGAIAGIIAGVCFCILVRSDTPATSAR